MKLFQKMKKFLNLEDSWMKAISAAKFFMNALQINSMNWHLLLEKQGHLVAD